MAYLWQNTKVMCVRFAYKYTTFWQPEREVEKKRCDKILFHSDHGACWTLLSRSVWHSVDTTPGTFFVGLFTSLMWIWRTRHKTRVCRWTRTTYIIESFLEPLHPGKTQLLRIGRAQQEENFELMTFSCCFLHEQLKSSCTRYLTNLVRIAWFQLVCGNRRRKEFKEQQCFWNACQACGSWMLVPYLLTIKFHLVRG